MQPTRRKALMLAAVALMPPASVSRSGPLPAPQILPSFDIEGVADGSRHRVFHAICGEAPAQGWPVLLLLDGNTTFPLAVEALARFPRPLLLLGLGYPETGRETIIRRRYFDLTSKAADDLIPRRAGAPVPQTGGRDAFVETMAERFFPAIRQRYPIDANRLSLFGHSLGGYLCLHALFSAATPFRSFIAADPSIWWNGGELRQSAKTFIAAENHEPRSLLIMTAGRKGPGHGQSASEAHRTAELRQGPGGQEMAAALESVPGLSVTFRHFPDETHGSLPGPAVAKAVAFAG